MSNQKIYTTRECKIKYLRLILNTSSLKEPKIDELCKSLANSSKVVIYFEGNKEKNKDKNQSFKLYSGNTIYDVVFPKDDFVYNDGIILNINEYLFIRYCTEIASNDNSKVLMMRMLDENLANNSILIEVDGVDVVTGGASFVRCSNKKVNEIEYIDLKKSPVDIKKILIDKLLNDNNTLEGVGEIKTIDDDFQDFLDEVSSANNYDIEALKKAASEDNFDGLEYDSIRPTESSANQGIIAYDFHLKVNNEDREKPLKSIIEKYSDFQVTGNDTDNILNDSILVGRKIAYDEYENILTLSFKSVDKSKFRQKGRIDFKFNELQAEIRKKAIFRLQSYYNNPLQNTYVDDFSQLSPIRNYDDNSDVLDGFKPLTVEEAEENASGNKPNDAQHEAIEKGCHLDNGMLLVLGPPGTGKTTVIVDWIKYYVSRGKRVLITSQSNMAVNNALEGAVKSSINGVNIECVRIGNAEKINDEEMNKILFDKKRTAFQNSLSENTTKNISKFNLENKRRVKDNGNLKELIGKLNAFNNDLSECTNSYSRISNLAAQEINKLNSDCFSLEYDINKLKSDLQKLDCFLGRLFRKKAIARKKLLLEQDEKNIIVKKNSLTRNLNVFNSNRRKYLNKVRTIIDTNSTDFAKYFFYLEYYDDYNIDFKFNKLNTIRDIIGHSKSMITNLEEYIEANLEKIERNKKLSAVVSDYQGFLSNHIEDFNSEYINNVNVVGATCIGINTNKEFKDVDFDVVIVDEAGQILTYDVLVPLSKAKEKIIMVGDHMQIPPVASPAIDSNEAGNEYTDEGRNLLTKSFFEMFYQKLDSETNIRRKRTQVLDTQYRMPDSICRYVSNHFYAKKYKSWEKKKNIDPLYPFFKSTFLLIDTSKYPKHHETKIPSGGYVNNTEVEIVTEIISLLKNNKAPQIDNGGIGIISGYKAQINKIKEELNKIIDPTKVNPMVKTLDSFQGQERELIIYSFVRSNTSISGNREDKKKIIGFLKEARRTNVALTRCKKQVICVGDFEFLSAMNEVTKEDEEIRSFSEFLSSIYEAGNNNLYTGNVNKDDVCTYTYRGKDGFLQ